MVVTSKPARLASSKARFSVTSVWGVLGVAAFLLNGLRRVIPVALEPLAKETGGLGLRGWMAYVLTGLVFTYVEGYRGFQLRFSPLVVRRALLLSEADARTPLQQVLAPAYAMAFFHATRRRKVQSYALLFGVLGIVVLVKRLPYPSRSILDAGVCMGLLYGTASLLAIFANAVRTGRAPDIDPCLPGTP
eukprot:TRINITY_DN68602_c0_g1_i1.p1 TRINITY_DN68602_c0_g1~~TRINITY_DN68602_c0_g1_i1.p1  ORF type:complete len:205 (+),score=17.01 TRINITY_DN68602_c0_g1_i1:46-615(+)